MKEGEVVLDLTGETPDDNSVKKVFKSLGRRMPIDTAKADSVTLKRSKKKWTNINPMIVAMLNENGDYAPVDKDFLAKISVLRKSRRTGNLVEEEAWVPNFEEHDRKTVVPSMIKHKIMQTHRTGRGTYGTYYWYENNPTCIVCETRGGPHKMVHSMTLEEMRQFQILLEDSYMQVFGMIPKMRHPKYFAGTKRMKNGQNLRWEKGLRRPPEPIIC